MVMWKDSMWDGYTKEALDKRRQLARYQRRMRWFGYGLMVVLWGLVLTALLVKF